MTVERVRLANGDADQALVPGVAPVSLARRQIAALETARREGCRDNGTPAGGLFDDVARSQLDFFG
jgi:hypothetical protein